jgi:UV DNA damage endonuclease
MLESKAKDLSLIRLRNDLARYAPELLPRYGIGEDEAKEDVSEVVATTAESAEPESVAG